MKTILLIDDEKSWGETLVTQLNKFSYNVILATSGYEGIEFAHKYLPDLILCDYSLPDINGFDVYEELHRTEFERIAPFIFISGKTDFKNINKKIKDLNCEFLTKPVRLKKIIETIEKIIGTNIFAKDNVLLVSNDDFYKFNLQKSLSVFNYELINADNLADLEKLLDNNELKFVLIDFAISESNGFEVINVLKEKDLLQKLHVIILDAKFNGKLFNRLIADGISDYLIKSYNFDELVKVLKIRSNQQKIPKKIFINNDAKLLIVDDDKELSKNLEYQLKKTGIQPVFANNGTEAIKLAQHSKPDIILCDIILPDFDGFRVHAELRNIINESKIPFIFQSGKGDWKSFRKALNYGVDGLLIKPFKFKELLSVLQNYIEIKNENKKETVKKDISSDINQTDSDQQNDDTAESNVETDKKQSEDDLNDVRTGTRRIIKKKYAIDYRLEEFINSQDGFKNYEKFIYNNIAIIKLNIQRAVLKEAQNFYKYFSNVILEGYNYFVIDLSNVEFIDSTFIGVLVSAKKRIAFNRGELKLVCNPQVSTNSYIMFDSLQNIFEIFDDIREVVDSFQKQLVN